MSKHITKPDEERMEKFRKYYDEILDRDQLLDIARRALADLKWARGLIKLVLGWVSGAKFGPLVHVEKGLQVFLNAYEGEQELDKDTGREELKRKLKYTLTKASKNPAFFNNVHCINILLDLYNLIVVEDHVEEEYDAEA